MTRRRAISNAGLVSISLMWLFAIVNLIFGNQLDSVVFLLFSIAFLQLNNIKAIESEVNQ